MALLFTLDVIMPRALYIAQFAKSSNVTTKIKKSFVHKLCNKTVDFMSSCDHGGFLVECQSEAALFVSLILNLVFTLFQPKVVLPLVPSQCL